jgi:hypothetical protein
MTWNFQSKRTEDDEADLAVCALSRESLQHEEWAKKQNDGPIQFKPFYFPKLQTVLQKVLLR